MHVFVNVYVYLYVSWDLHLYLYVQMDVCNLFTCTCCTWSGRTSWSSTVYVARCNSGSVYMSVCFPVLLRIFVRVSDRHSIRVSMHVCTPKAC